MSKDTTSKPKTTPAEQAQRKVDTSERVIARLNKKIKEHEDEIASLTVERDDREAQMKYEMANPALNAFPFSDSDTGQSTIDDVIEPEVAVS